jgi:hypothetical protein
MARAGCIASVMPLIGGEEVVTGREAGQAEW